MKVMVLRPTIFEIEAENFEKAKKQIIEGLINSRQMKPSDPIEFREIVDYELKEEENKQEDKKDDNGSKGEDNHGTTGS